jgi:DNA-binding NtrC family response regulator
MRLLIVDDDQGVRQTIFEVAAEWQVTPFEAENAQTACTALKCRPDLLFVNVRLPDASGMTVIEAALSIRPIPAMIAISDDASPKEAFELARLGVHAYLAKPLSPDEIRATKEAIVRQRSIVPVFAAARVGRETLQDVQAGVRKAMVEQALAMTAGNRTEAARLLGVSRQAVQQMIRDIGLE